MDVLILDEYLARKVLKQRKESPSYRMDEIWDGIYIAMPISDIQHSNLAELFMISFYSVYGGRRGNRVHGHINISDRNKDWMENVRCPDVALFLKGHRAKDRFTHWQGGGDLLVEVVTRGDRCREKLEFYAKVGTREAIIVDRDPWQLELYRLQRGKLKLVRSVNPGDGESITSSLVPFEYRLIRSRPRPKLKIVHTETGQEWVC